MSLTDQAARVAPTDRAARLAACTNAPECPKAVAQEALEWYPGPGEYCPECGEALALADGLTAEEVTARLYAAETAAVPPQTTAAPPALAAAAALETTAPEPPTGGSSGGLLRPVPSDWRPGRTQRSGLGRLWPWVVVAICLAGAALAYAMRRSLPANSQTASAITVCPVSSAQQLAVDLVRGYTAKSGSSANRFAVGDSAACDVRFSTAASTPDAVIARDGIVAIVNPLNPILRISEKQLRAIFGGSLRDWSQLGGPPGPIIALMPAPGSDEANAIASSLLFNLGIDSGVHRPKTSADVTRAVAGADRTSRNAIGLVAFSAAIPAKVVPLAYLPAPSVLTIATGRYPYTMRISIEPSNGRANAAAVELVDYARSGEGAAIVAKDGLISREGF